MSWIPTANISEHWYSFVEMLYEYKTALVLTLIREFFSLFLQFSLMHQATDSLLGLEYD